MMSVTSILAVALLVILVIVIRARNRLAAPVRKSLIGTLIALILLAAGLVLFIRCSRFMEIDRCLDAGGRWNAETESCEFAD